VTVRGFDYNPLFVFSLLPRLCQRLHADSHKKLMPSFSLIFDFSYSGVGQTIPSFSEPLVSEHRTSVFTLSPLGIKVELRVPEEDLVNMAPLTSTEKL